MTDRKYPLRCHFCARTQDEVEKLIVGAFANICDYCASLALEIAQGHGDKGNALTATEAADRIEKLEADNARLRRDKETLLTFAQAIQTWRSDADSYDRECEQPQRNYCEDVELMEKAAGYALRRVAERAALQETSHDA